MHFSELYFSPAGWITVSELRSSSGGDIQGHFISSDCFVHLARRTFPHAGQNLRMETVRKFGSFFKDLQEEECHRLPTPYQPHFPGKSRLAACRAGVQFPHCCLHKRFPNYSQIPVL